MIHKAILRTHKCAPHKASPQGILCACMYDAVYAATSFCFAAGDAASGAAGGATLLLVLLVMPLPLMVLPVMLLMVLP